MKSESEPLLHLKKQASREGRDPRTRRILYGLTVLWLLTLVALVVVAWSAYFDQKSKAQMLAQQIDLACELGTFGPPEDTAELCSDANQANPKAPILIPGPECPQGIPGINGANGTDGKNGKNGANGQPGEDGEDGDPGSNGQDGTNGASGVDGAPGETGPAGPAGPPGPQGEQGPPLVWMALTASTPFHSRSASLSDVVSSRGPTPAPSQIRTPPRCASKEQQDDSERRKLRAPARGRGSPGRARFGE